MDLLAQRVSPGGRVVGLDADALHVAMAGQFVASLGLDEVEIVTADATHSGLTSGSFDLVHARTLLINVPDPDEVVAEMVRLTKPGGWVASMEPDTEFVLCYPPKTAYARVCEIFPLVFARDGADPHMGRRVPGLLRDAGLEDVGVERDSASISVASPGWPEARSGAPNCDGHRSSDEFQAEEPSQQALTTSTRGRHNLTSDDPAGPRLMGSLLSADGTGIVRMEDRFDTDIDDVWSALTEPSRLSRWIGEVEGDLRLGGEFHRRFFASGSEGTGRVDACEPPRRLLVTLDPGEPNENVIEVILASEGERTRLVWEERGLPLDNLAAYGAGIQIHVEDLASHLAGGGPCDADARWDELQPAYEVLAVHVR